MGKRHCLSLYFLLNCSNQDWKLFFGAVNWVTKLHMICSVYVSVSIEFANEMVTGNVMPAPLVNANGTK